MNTLTAPSVLLFLQGGGGGGGTMFLILQLVALFAIFYFFLIRPQQKRQRLAQQERDKLLNALKPGDKVITSSGIFATVVSVRDDRVQVKVAPSVAIEVQRTAITSLQSDPKEAEPAK
jgi:preprotein translocase subunit YajC